jgi:UrcA family protein
MNLDEKPLTEKEPAMNTNTFHTRKLVALAAAAALCFPAIAAQAGDTAGELPTRTVGYADLDLGTQAGATALYNRIYHAAEQVCGDTGSRQLAEVLAVRACVNRAVSASVKSVHNARLASVYDSHIAAMR